MTANAWRREYRGQPASAPRSSSLAPAQRVRRHGHAVWRPRAIGLVAAGRVDVRPFVSHRFALDEAGEAFRVLADRSGLNVVVEPQRRAQHRGVQYT